MVVRRNGRGMGAIYNGGFGGPERGREKEEEEEEKLMAEES